MTELADSLWVEASADVASEARERALALARVKCSGVWPFLSGANGVEEYRHRLALAGERVEAACDEVAPGDRALALQLVAGLEADFLALHASRSADRELAAGVAAELARRVPSTPAPPASPVGMSATSARALRDRLAEGADIRRRAADEAEPAPEPAAQEPATDGLEQAPEPLSVGAPRLGYGSGTDQVDCPECGATGSVPGDGRAAPREECPVCHGEKTVPATEAHAWHTSSRRATCRKCVSGRTPDRQACGYCQGHGSLDPAMAAIQAADGWDQGLVATTAQGGVQFDPEAFGSERWQKLAPPAQPPWIVDEWGSPPPAPGPSEVVNPADGHELAQTGAAHKVANPYLEDNRYRTHGPGLPGSAESPGSATYPRHPGDIPSEVVAPADQMLGDADRLSSTRRAQEEFSRPPDVVSRLAARVLAANPEVGHEAARRVALATLHRFPAIRPGR